MSTTARSIRHKNGLKMSANDNLKFLHIHCGDASAKILKKSEVPGDIMVWREIYLEGPVPGNLSDEEFRKTRAKFISSSIPGLIYENVLAGMNSSYEKPANAGKYEEVVLWFDSCMFDQTIMIHLIELCSKQDLSHTKLSLICIDRGLGELTMEELAALIDTRSNITRKQKTLANKAWKAFRSDTPESISKIINEDCSDLPYLQDALKRHLEQLPSITNGLNRTQNQILEAVSEGADNLIQIFKTVSEMETRPFMGDTSLWQRIDELAECKTPLLKLQGPGRLKNAISLPNKIDAPSIEKIESWKISITETGKNILKGKNDFIKLNGIDVWLGGIHLTEENQWRWDKKRQMPLCLNKNQ
jgi:hypothetical protein